VANFTAMSTNPEKEERNSRSYRIPLTLLLAFGVYVISVGPVLTTADRFKLGATRFYRPLRAFYAPVFAVAQSSDFGTRVYEGYVGFWCRIILKREYPKYVPAPPLEGLITSIASITNGQTSFQIFVPSKLSQGGHPTSQDVALAQIVGKVRERGLLPAGFQQQADGRLYTFEREREWERTK
jgi:hypothetical protein